MTSAGRGIDRRSHFATPRVAHVSLEGQVSAPRFSAGEAAAICAPVAALHPDPESRAMDRQLLHGAAVTVLERLGGRAFLRDAAMGYVGWVARDALGPPQVPTHRVGVRGTLRFAGPDFKTPDPVALPFGALVRVMAREGRYAALAGGGFVIAEHLAPCDAPETDPVSCAERHLGAPYLWGGNSAFGIDCSGLVQVALAACGHPCPGDSDLQEAALGATLPAGARPARGDLMFWKGHVAWLADPDTLLHANAHHMAVAHEPLDAAVARIAAQGGGPVTRHARLSPDLA